MIVMSVKTLPAIAITLLVRSSSESLLSSRESLTLQCHGTRPRKLGSQEP